MNQWHKLCKALSSFEAEEPALEGLRWSLYLSSSELRSVNIFRTVLGQIRRWALAMISPPQLEIPVWYALHNMMSSHLLPFRAVMDELANRGIRGQVIGPYPYMTIDLALRWSQMPLAEGRPETGLRLFWQLRTKAKDLARPIREKLLEEEIWLSRTSPSEEALTTLLWNILRLDWNIEQRVKRYTPKVLVLGSDLGPLRNPLTRHARANGAFTMVLQHGLQSEYAGSVSSDIVSLWGEYHRRKTIELGAPPESLVIDGSPRMDKILKLTRDPEVRRKARLSLNISEKTPTLLVFLETIELMKKMYPDIWSRFLVDAREAFYKLSKEIVILVRPHPGDTEAAVASLNLPGIRIVPSNSMEFHVALAIADVVSTTLSATGLEALWCGIPVIYYQPTGIPSVVDFPELGGGIAVRDANEWVQAAQQLTRSPETRRRVLAASAEFSNDTLAFPGEATRRVVDRIEAHLSKKH